MVSITQFTLSLSLVLAHVLAGTVRLPAYPLAVRNPWLSAWLKGDAAADAPSGQATFWNGITLGWEVMARVGDDVYTLFGYPRAIAGTSHATQNSVNYTSTHTTISLTAGSASITLDFFSPVSPNNLLRQSLPYSYLTVTITASNTAVQVFSAIDQAWTGQTTSAAAQLFASGNTYMYTLNNTQSEDYEVKNEMALWGSVVYATRAGSSSTVRHQCGTAAGVHASFVSATGLSSSSTTACQADSGSIFAYSHDLGKINGSSSTTYAIGHSRTNAINYLDQPQTNYYQATYPNIPAAVDAFFDDYEDALTESRTLDAQVRANGSSISSNYADILEASVRQSFGAMEVTIPADTLNTSKPWVFLKEISSDADIQTIDVIFPTFPIFHILAPSWTKYLLDPVLSYVQTNWSHEYMVHDLGKYPLAIGHPNGNAEFMPVDVTGMAMVLIYAYQNRTGDTAWAVGYSDVLRIYANYLVANGTANQGQLATVDAVPNSKNQTMLAVQSAIGLVAYGKLTGLANYSKAGLDLADKLYTQGIALDTARTHFTFNYGDSSSDPSWSVMFPFFTDALLGLNTFPTSAYTMMSSWYAAHFEPYGLPYKFDLDWGITDWNMWAGAVASDQVRDKIIDTTHMFLTNPGNGNKPFQTKYDVMGSNAGKAIQNIARSTVGANFATLALIMSSGNTTAIVNGPNVTSGGTSSNSASGSATGSASALKSDFMSACWLLAFVSVWFFMA